MEGLQGSYWNYRTSSIPELKGPAEPGKEQEFLRMPLLCVCSSLQQDRKVSSCSEIPRHFDTGYSLFPSWTWAPQYLSLLGTPELHENMQDAGGTAPSTHFLELMETCEQQAVLWVRRAMGSWDPETSVCYPQQEHLQAACMGGLWTPRTHPSGFIP